MATFDSNRTGPGTFELVRDPNTGNYSINEVNFTKISPLNLPDLDTAAATTTAATTTAAQTQTATDTTGDTVSQQTKMAFNIPDTSGDNKIDTTGNMLQEAKKTSSMLDDTFDSPEMTRRDEAKITSPLDIQSPTERVFDRPNMRDVAGEVQQDRPIGPVLGEDRIAEIVEQQKAAGVPDEGLITNFRPNMADVANNATSMTKEPSATRTAKEADFASGTLGIDTERFKGVSQMGALAGNEKQDVKPEVKQSALETVSTSLRTAKDSVLSNLKTPMMMAIDTVVGAVVSPEQQASNKFDASYFNVKDDGRIAGNAATDLFSGMNAQSAFGNKSKSGASRIETREETIDKKGYGPGDKFYDDTQKMKNQLNNYNNAKDSDKDVSAAKNEAALSKQEAARTGQYDKDGGGSGGSSKIVCTMMNQRYGFGSFRNKIWLKFHKNYSAEYQKGYHKLFLPLVNIAKKEGIFSAVVRKILEHMGRHVTADMFQIMRNKKSNKLGRIYRKIFEPICYWLGGK